MGFALIMFLAVFLLIASGGLILFYREAMLERISEVINPKAKKTTLISAIQDSGFSLGGMVEHLESVLPKSQAEQSVVRQRLIRAGYRADSAIKTFYGAKVLIPLILCATAAVSGAAHYVGAFFLYVVCLGIGFLAPDFWLGNRIKKRKRRISRGLPDVLDLLVICVEAGLSIDQATARASIELEKAQPELCDELNVVVLEQRAGRPRADAWKHMAERTDEENVRNLVSMLVQAEQFGTSIAKTLRIHSDTLRTKRVQEVEEAAAKLTIKLLFPLVFFIFPSLFLVVLGPVVITMMENFKSLFGGK
jgi:tight adherence protein C